MKISLYSLFGLLLMPAAHGQNTDWNAINMAITDAHVLPAYQHFAEASSGLATAAENFCAAVTPESLTQMQQAFGESFDGWQGVQHIQFGPITYFSWNFRMQYWPDDNGTGGRQLTALLASGDMTALEPDTFARQSVGVQGYPALERLLFDTDSLALLQAEPYRCLVVSTIAANLSSMASGVYAQWRDEFRQVIATADERGFFESAEDATIDFMKGLVESIRRNQQQKLEAVLGESQAEARPRRAEAWRSERSVSNLQLNLAALTDLYSAGEPALRSTLLPADLPGVDASFIEAKQSLDAAPASLTAALETTEGYAAVKQARDAFDALFEALEAALKHTDLYLGFNSLDGD